MERFEKETNLGLLQKRQKSGKVLNLHTVNPYFLYSFQYQLKRSQLKYKLSWVLGKLTRRSPMDLLE